MGAINIYRSRFIFLAVSLLVASVAFCSEARYLQIRHVGNQDKPIWTLLIIRIPANGVRHEILSPDRFFLVDPSLYASLDRILAVEHPAPVRLCGPGGASYGGDFGTFEISDRSAEEEIVNFCYAIGGAAAETLIRRASEAVRVSSLQPRLYEALNDVLERIHSGH